MSSRQSGFTLVEMIMAMVIIAVGLAGLVTLFRPTVATSADPLINKQLIAATEDVMEEILLKPYAISGTAPSPGTYACGSSGAVRNAFDDVRDYNGYTTTGLCSIDGVTVGGLGDANMAVTVLSENFNGVANALRVTVTVTRGGNTFTLVGWRTDYAT